MKTKVLIALFLGMALGVQPVSAATYSIDTDHSTVSFKIKHLFSKVQGTFNQFEGEFEYEPNQPEIWSAHAVIHAASIDTRVEERDKHLRSKDFFDVETYPEIRFDSAKITDAGTESAKIHGDLTLHGITKSVVLNLEILGETEDPWGNVVASFTATTKINRKDFGLEWNEVLETGQLLVGEEVTITLDIAGYKQ